MSMTAAISRNSVFFFAAVLLFAVWGFWPTYIARDPTTLFVPDHAHGAVMLAWCLLLIAQAGLIRAKRRDLHRMVGKVSYALVPAIVISTLSVAHFRFNLRDFSAEGLYTLALQLALLVQFVVAYALAIRYRKLSDVHARFMVCTAFPLLDPILARILLVNFLPDIPFESGIAQYITFAFTDLLLLGLVVRDWKYHGRKDVFLPMLVVLLATQLPVFYSADSALWQAFAGWYQALPLSR